MNLCAFVCIWIGWGKKEKKELKIWGKHFTCCHCCHVKISFEMKMYSFLSYSIRYIQNCPLERCFPSAGDSVNILLLLVLHVLEFMAERKGFSLEETRSERSTQTTFRILQKVPIFRGSDELVAEVLLVDWSTSGCVWGHSAWSRALREARLMLMHRDQRVSLVCNWTHINDITVLRSLQIGIFNFYFFFFAVTQNPDFCCSFTNELCCWCIEKLHSVNWH